MVRAKPSVPTLAPKPSSLLRGLVGAWPFAEGGGTSVRNLAIPTRGVNATFTGAGMTASRWRRSWFGYAVETTGTGGDRLTVAHNAAFDFSTDQEFTVVVIFRSTANNGASDGLVEKWGNSGPLPYAIRNSGTDTVAFSRYDGTNNPTVTGAINIDDALPHVVVCLRRSDTLYLFVDGRQDGSTADSTTGTTTNTSAILIGDRVQASRAYQGEFFDLRIWNRAITMPEILRLSYDPFGMYRYERIQGFVPSAITGHPATRRWEQVRHLAPGPAGFGRR